MGTEGGVGGDGIGMGMSYSSSDHKKDDGKGDEGSGLMVEMGSSKIRGTIDSKGSNKDDKKLDTGRDKEATGGIDDKTGIVEVIGIRVEDSEVGDCKSEGVNVGKGIEGMDGLVCEPTSDVMMVSKESRVGSGISTAVGVKKMSSSGGKSACTLTSIWSL